MKQEAFVLGIKLGLSILLSLVLSILPLSESLQWWQPAWLLLVLIFWIFVQPGYLGLVSIFFLGLYQDLLTESALGQHAIPLLLVCYLLLKFQARLRIFPFVRQFLVMFVLIVIYYGTQYELVNFIRPISWHWRLFYPVISTSVLWIGLFNLLKNHERHLKKW